jgi:RimJ/RimL family protein N-acetyltransferase
MEQPVIKTDRLFLRAFEQSDAEAVERHAGDKRISSKTVSIPYPYDAEMAKDWINGHPERFQEGKGVDYAVVTQHDLQLVGAIGLSINQTHKHAELGYWIGEPYWGKGYATEAAASMLRYGFEERNLNRIFAHYFAHNPASGRVMQKIGMQLEGLLREHIYKDGKFVDLYLYSILRADFIT